MSKVATSTRNLSKKLALAGNLRLNIYMWVESWMPLIILQRWFNEAARIRFTIKLLPIIILDEPSTVSPDSSSASASYSEGICLGISTSSIVPSAIAYPYSSVN